MRANTNFLDCVGYRLDEVQGRHHRMFCTPEHASSVEYATFWEKTGQGRFRRRAVQAPGQERARDLVAGDL
ncbi:hypothetical protein [Pseudomonas syringae]|uniref:hypothetical protein n=1 Tax=Pseudomonas syringae TaxID=317 RepID=UPI001EF090E5